MRLALHVIAKDEVEHIRRIVNDYALYFDEVAIAYDGDAEKLAEEFAFEKKVKIHQYKWRDDFAHKRNWLAERTESDYYFRLDTDDVISDPKNVKPLFNDVVNNKMDIVYLPYLYSKDKDGNCVAKHYRDTIIKKSKNMKWVGTVHESMIIEDMSKFKGIKDGRVFILHEIEEGHDMKSAMRNFKILKEEYVRDKENTDPRTLAYLGRMLLGVGEYDKAKSFLELLVLSSGWEDDKYFGYCELGHCWSQLGDFDRAISACMEALILNVEYPDAYLELSQVYNEKKDYDRAIHWGKIGMTKREPDTLSVVDPTKYTYRSFVNMAIAYFHKGDYKTAKTYYDKAYEIAPNEDFIKKNQDLFHEAERNNRFVMDYANCLKFLNRNDPAKCVDFVKAIPKQLMQDERMHQIRNQFLPAKEWGKEDVTIYCYNTLFEWGPPSVISGVGGSEEAVIYLSKELTKLGHNVTVYCNCGEFEGEYEGVVYKQAYEFNPNDSFNVLVSWRHNIFYGDIKAKKKLVWLHDLPDPKQIKQWFKGTDAHKVLALSEFHKEEIGKYFDKKRIVVSANGINLKDFEKNGVMRNPKRMIYTSSYDRGIEHLLKMWPDIRKEVPDAELYLFYGWNTYDKFVECGMRDVGFKKEMVKLMEQEGIHECGRVGHRQLVKEFQKSRFWVYPSHFEEISCISAMKAQACGCTPVVTDYAALKETVKDGVIVKGRLDNQETYEAYKGALVEALKNPPEVKVDKEQFSWSHVAKQWSEELFV